MHHLSLFANLCLHCIVSVVTGLQILNGIRQFQSSSQSCDSVSWVIPHRTVMRSVTAKSRSDCIQVCVNEITCVDSVLYWNDSDDSKMCFLLAYKKGLSQTLFHSDNCFYISPKACQNNGQYIDGLCRCPSGFTGIYCELANEAFCSEEHQMVHHAVGTSSTSYNYPMDGRTTLNALKAQNIKVSTDSLVPGHVSIGVNSFKNFRDNIWGSQLLDSLTVTTGTSGIEFESPAKVNAMLLKATGQLEVMQYNLDNTGPARTFLYGNNKVYVRPSEGELAMEPTFGSVDAIIQAVKDGHEPASCPPFVMYDGSRDAVVMKGTRVTMAVKSPQTYQIPMYFFNIAFDGNTGRKQIYRERFTNSDNFQVMTESTTWLFNPCWYEATFDGRQPSSPSTVHLRRALQEGHRVRVVYEGLSSQVKVVYLTNDYVLFQISPYVTPKHYFTMDAASVEVHSLVSSSGRVKSCFNKMAESNAVDHEDYLIENGDINWFVDSRKWELLYTTFLSGNNIEGQFSELKQAVTDGSDVHIVLEINSGALYIGMLAEWVHVGATSITAEIKSVTDVEFTDSDFIWPDPARCQLVNYLIDTHKGVKAITYTYGPNPIEENSSLASVDGVVYWFVSR